MLSCHTIAASGFRGSRCSLALWQGLPARLADGAEQVGVGVAVASEVGPVTGLPRVEVSPSAFGPRGALVGALDADQEGVGLAGALALEMGGDPDDVGYLYDTRCWCHCRGIIVR